MPTRLGLGTAARLPASYRAFGRSNFTVVSIESPYCQRLPRLRRVHKGRWAYFPHAMANKWRRKSLIRSFAYVWENRNTTVTASTTGLPPSSLSGRLLCSICIHPSVLRFSPPIVKSLFQCHSQRLQYACPKQTLQNGHLPSGSGCAFKVLHWQHVHCEVTDPKIRGMLS